MTAPSRPRPIADLDVPLPVLLQQIARLRVDAWAARLQRLIAHPETAAKPATDGDRAEYRHLLYDADADAQTPAFPYPNHTPREAS